MKSLIKDLINGPLLKNHTDSVQAKVFKLLMEIKMIIVNLKIHMLSTQ